MKRSLKLGMVLPCLLLSSPHSFSTPPEKQFLKGEAIAVTDIASPLTLGERWGKKSLKLPKTQNFTKNDPGGDANNIGRISLRYFTSADCTGSSVYDFSTATGSISTSQPFGLVSTALFKVGNQQLQMNTINSIAVILKATNSNVPQAAFSAISSTLCINNIDCSTGSTCTVTGDPVTIGYDLNDNAAVGDPADGGLIGSLVDGAEFVIQVTDNSSFTTWENPANNIDITNASSPTDGASNSAIIIDCLTNNTGVTGCSTAGSIPVANYAAGICSTHTEAGGYDSGWYLPAIEQLEVMFDFKSSLNGLSGIIASSNNLNATQITAGNYTGGSWATFTAGKTQLGGGMRCAKALVVN